MRSALIVFFVICFGQFAAAQEAVPDARVAMSADMDYPGGDLAAIFDTTLDACQNACLANS